MTTDAPLTWIDAAADLAIENHQRHKAPGEPIICASGVSPSGPIHLGNLREIFTAHFVAEELRRRGLPVEHIHSWDDYDRFRKVPAGAPESWSQYLGRPLSEVPDPDGVYPSWADKHIHECETALARLGVTMRGIRQSVEYKQRRTYVDAIDDCLRRRGEIFDVLAQYQTEKLQTKSVEERRAEFWPLRVYDPDLGTDDTTVESYEPDGRVVRYRIDATGEARSFSLNEACHAKLVWKVDWPMRWRHERVDFEPGGPDHSAPAGSYTVGTQLAPLLFDWAAPAYIQYSFVGFGGAAKMSSSAGAVPTPAYALRFMEPVLLRWLYLRRKSTSSFDISFGTQMWRAYDELDALQRRVAKGAANEVEVRTLERTLATSVGPTEQPAVSVPFRTLWTAIDVSGNTPRLIARILRDSFEDDALPDDDDALLAAVEPRLSCAQSWLDEYVPEADRIIARETFDPETWASLDDVQREMVGAFVARLGDQRFTLKALEALVYGVPKLHMGLEMADKPTPEVKKLQRSFFIALYRLILSQDRGPRLPTLLVSLGPDRAAALLTP
jgi:lysyl-tRNA synthetase class 1